MSIFSRALFAFCLIITTLAWSKVPGMYPGLLDTSNWISLLSAMVLIWLWFYGFKTEDRQVFWKAMMVVLTLSSLGAFIWLLSGATVVLAVLCGLTLVSLGVLYDPIVLTWYDRFTRNRQIRRARKASSWNKSAPAWNSSELRQVRDPHDVGVDLFDDEPSPAS